MKKKLLVLLLAVMLVFVGCAGKTEDASSEGSGSADGKPKVGFLLAIMNDTWLNYLLEEAQAAADEYGIELLVQDGQNDVVRQQDQVNTLIRQGVDVLIVNPIDTSATEPITKAATDAGIPLIYVNRNPFWEDPSKMPEGVYYVGSDSVVSGKLQAERLVEILGEDAEAGVAILMGELTHEAAIQRTQGNEEVLSQYPGYKILAKEPADWQSDLAMNVAENFITAYGDDLNVILSNNDMMAIGALEALAAKGRDDVIVMGIDAVPQALDLVEEGKMAATVFQNAKGQGKGSIEMAKQLLDGKEPEERILWVDYELVLPDNVDDYR